MNSPRSLEELFSAGNQDLAAGRLQAAIAAFSQILLEQADDWQALGNRALAHYRAGAYDKSLQDYCLALQIRPDADHLLTNFAVLLKELGQLASAEALLRQALQQNARNADAWSNLGIVRQHQLRYEQAVHCHIQAMEIAGASPARWTNLGNALTGALQLEQALEAYQHALELQPDYHEARYNQSIPLLTLGRYRQAWPAYEARWQTILRPRFTRARWQGEALESGTLLLWSEQGLGDSLQMVRYLPLIRVAHPRARLVLSCPRSLHRLFSRIEGLELIAEDAEPGFDWQIPLASLPGVFQSEIDSLPLAPYLSADPALSAHWAAALPPRRPGVARIGLVWQSGVWGVGVRDLCRQQKSLEASALLPLLGLADFVSLQPEALPDCLQGRLTQPKIGDFADTAAIITHLDLVISVDTAVAHLSGAMGWPVWILMRHEGAPFFMARGDRAPWYPSARLWRQDAPGDWTPVLARLQHRLSTEPAP